MNAHAPQPTCLAPPSAQKTGLAHVPAACTTSAAVRQHAVEPAAELQAIARKTQRLLVELAVLSKRSDELARQIAGFTDAAAQRLEHQERTNLYTPPTVCSELPNWQKVAERAAKNLDRLADRRQREKHGYSRDNLHAIFETFGDELFTNAQFQRRVGVNRLLSLRHEYDAWKAGAC